MIYNKNLHFTTTQLLTVKKLCCYIQINATDVSNKPTAKSMAIINKNKRKGKMLLHPLQ